MGLECSKSVEVLVRKGVWLECSKSVEVLSGKGCGWSAVSLWRCC